MMSGSWSVSLASCASQSNGEESVVSESVHSRMFRLVWFLPSIIIITKNVCYLKVSGLNQLKNHIETKSSVLALLAREAKGMVKLLKTTCVFRTKEQ